MKASLGALALVILLGVPVFAQEGYRVEAEAAVSLDYVFADSPDHFIVKYLLTLDGEVEGDSVAIQGEGRATARVMGFLKRWESGACALQVQVEAVPFEMTFSKMGEGMIRLRTQIGDFGELWRSSCTFHDKPGIKFITTGKVEEWLAKTLKKVAYLLRDIQMPVDPKRSKPNTLTREINRFTIDDPPLGEADVDGKLVLKVTPRG